MNAHHYAKAFHDLRADKKIEEGKLVRQFVATVSKNGHAHLLPKIVRSLERMSVREEKKQTIEVTSAETLSPDRVSKLLKEAPFKNALLPSHKKVIRKVDETLVGGVVVRIGGERIDGSYKRSLLDLYQLLTSQ